MIDGLPSFEKYSYQSLSLENTILIKNFEIFFLSLTYHLSCNGESKKFST